jgi:hypothetical protein
LLNKANLPGNDETSQGRSQPQSSELRLIATGPAQAADDRDFATRPHGLESHREQRLGWPYVSGPAVQSQTLQTGAMRKRGSDPKTDVAQ